MAVPAVVVKAATAVLSDKKGRKTVGWILIAILSPIILLVVLLYTMLSGVVSENALILESVFYQVEMSSTLSDETRQSIETMQDCFDTMDEQIEEENLDENLVKSIFYQLYFGKDEQALEASEIFVSAFLTEDLQTIYQTIEDNFVVDNNTTWQTDSQNLYDFLQTGESFYTLVAGMGNFVEPVPDWKSSVSDEYGWRIHPISGAKTFHQGIDIAKAKGTPIYAVAGGTITKAVYGTTGYGYHLVIDHGDGMQTKYAHASKLLVEVGQVVTAGEQIAEVGTTGSSTGNHLHFEVILNGETQDPRAYLP